MAQVQYGVIITELKGAIGGSVFQAGNNTKVFRNKGYRKGKSSTIRQAVVARMVGQTSRWRALSDIQREAWQSARTGWAFTDKYGNSYYGSGYQFFVAFNTAMVSIGEPAVDVPNVTVEYETIVPTAPTFVFQTELDWNIDTLTTGSQIVQCYASAPMSPGISGDNAKYKYIGQFDSSLADQFNDTTIYRNLFGWAPVGSLVMFKMVIRPATYPRAQQTIIQRCIVTV